MLDQLLAVVTAAVIVSYSIYIFLTFADPNLPDTKTLMVATIPFAVYGVFRYLLLVHSKDLGADPETMFKDKPMVINIMLWVLVAIVSLYDLHIQVMGALGII